MRSGNRILDHRHFSGIPRAAPAGLINQKTSRNNAAPEPAFAAMPQRKYGFRHSISARWHDYGMTQHMARSRSVFHAVPEASAARWSVFAVPPR
jgi:hypothetical protein